MNISILNQINNGKHIKASDSSNWLLAHGISAVTTDELSALLGIPKSQIPQRMAALKKHREIVSPANGLWIPVSPEYRTWGAPPAIDMINAIMKHMESIYYVGWLSAAEYNGASHHAPQVFQVATSRVLRKKSIGRAYFQFYNRNHITSVSCTHIESKNGLVPVSDIETTLLDVSNDIKLVGGIDNATNIIIELCDSSKLNIKHLSSLSKYYPVTAARRLGFLMEHFTHIKNLEILNEASSQRKAALSLLDPLSDSSGSVNTKWKIKINREVSPDV